METKHVVMDWMAVDWDKEEPPTVAEGIELGGLRFLGSKKQCELFLKTHSDGAWLDIEELENS